MYIQNSCGGDYYANIAYCLYINVSFRCIYCCRMLLRIFSWGDVYDCVLYCVCVCFGVSGVVCVFIVCVCCCRCGWYIGEIVVCSGMGECPCVCVCWWYVDVACCVCLWPIMIAGGVTGIIAEAAHRLCGSSDCCCGSGVWKSLMGCTVLIVVSVKEMCVHVVAGVQCVDSASH